METGLSKSDFLRWRACPKSFWLERHRPEQFPGTAPSPFARLLMEQGYEVEAQARRLVEGWPNADRCSFQRVFTTGDGLIARADLVWENGDATIDIIEIKASTSLRGSASDHVVDACFQTVVAERAGLAVRSVSVMHVNGAYVRSGGIEPAALLCITDVTGEVDAMKAGIAAEMDDALAWIAQDSIDEHHCDCRYLGNSANRCAAFAYLNPDIPELSAHLLPRIARTKLETLDAEGRLAIADLGLAEVTPLQRVVLEALQGGEPVINPEAIRNFIDGLAWPLWFYDYETFASAIPVADGHQPHLPVPVQYSVHRLDEDGTLTHFEFLAQAAGEEDSLVTALRSVIGPEGTALSWNMSTEKSCNKRMAALCPHHAEFLADLNVRTLDLMEVFNRDWVEPGFMGSTSIKKVLPVLVPELAYADDDVHDGTGAILAWREMIGTSDDARRAELQRQLLAYCELDTLAMVRIFERLRDFAWGR